MRKAFFILSLLLIVFYNSDYCNRCVFENLLESSLDGKMPPNVGHVDNLPLFEIYRSGMIKTEHLSSIKSLRVKKIITLNTLPIETKGEILITDIKHIEFNLSSGELTVQNISEVVSEILWSEGPIWIHCRGGADRTGMVIAALRIHFGEYDKQKLLIEMRNYCHITLPRLECYHELLDKLIEQSKNNSS